MPDHELRIVLFIFTGLLSCATAIACLRRRGRGIRYADAEVWAILSAIYLLLALTSTIRGLGLLHGFGAQLRDVFKTMGWYDNRRGLQVFMTLAIAVVTVIVLFWGLAWAWHLIKRYRLAIGFTGLIIGFGLIRFISLHEVDAWVAHAPWWRTIIDIVAAASVSVMAVLRLRQLRSLGRRRYRIVPSRRRP